MKVEIWVQGQHASSEQILVQWNQIKYANLNMNSKSDLISKIYYIDKNGGITQLTW